MKTLTFLLSTVIELYTMALLLRVWMQWARCDFYNPFSQFVVKITQPVVGPLRRIIPAMGPIDSASLLVAFILSVIKAIVLFMVITFQPIIWIAAVLILIKTIGLLIFWVLLVMAIMSWVSQGRSPVEYALIQLAEPLLRPIRNLLPSMGGIDFSPMILVLLLYVVNMGIAELLQSTGDMLLPGLWIRPYILAPSTVLPSLPAAATTTMPASTSCLTLRQTGSFEYESIASPPRLRFTTLMLYVVRLLYTQSCPLSSQEVWPAPAALSTLTLTILALGAIPR